MRPRIMPVVVLALVVVAFSGAAALAATVPAPPYDTNSECLECHDLALGGAALSKVEFADSVDYSACVKCHWVSPGAPYVFDHGKVLGAPYCRTCHFYMSTARPWAGQVTTAYGSFATSESLGLSASTVHAAHVNGSWPGASLDCDDYCKSCHGAAGCSVCHTASLAEGGHGMHVAASDPLLPEYEPAVYPTATGVDRTPAVVSTVNYASSSVTCAASGCHPRGSLSTAPIPSCGDCHASKTSVHGYDSVDHVADDAMLDGTACSACHSLELATAHGDPGAAGESCTTCHPAPRDTFGEWDQSCATGGCHTADSSAPMHGEMAAAHTATLPSPGCSKCHSADIRQEHLDRSVTCMACHDGSYADLFAAGWDTTCDACHSTRHKDRTSR